MRKPRGLQKRRRGCGRGPSSWETREELQVQFGERDSLCNKDKKEKKREVFCSTKRKKIGELATGSHGIHHTERKPADQRKKGPPSQDEITSALTLASPILDSTRSSTHDARCYPQRKQGGPNHRSKPSWGFFSSLPITEPSSFTKLS